MTDAEEQYLFVVRTMQFANLATVYRDYLSGHYHPSSQIKWSQGDADPGYAYLSEFGPTLMFILYSFFYSLVEDDTQSLNGFRIWLARYPEESVAILALRGLVGPFLPELRTFRNKLGFHGSRSHGKQAKGFDLFANVPGGRIFELMELFKSLNAALLAKELALAKNSSEEMSVARLRIDEITSRCKQMNL